MKLVRLAVLVAASGFISQAQAEFITFVPPNDPTGQVWSTNTNDGYSAGRGLVFQMDSNVLINSIGIFHNLTGINLSFNIAQVNTSSGIVTNGQTILRSGSSNVSTNGLEWIDYAIAPLQLIAGSIYHIDFSFSGNGNQNFFYNNGNVPFSQSGFSSLDGTAGGNTGNFVMSAFRVNAGLAPEVVPLPTTAIPCGLGLLGLVIMTSVRRLVFA